MKIIVADNAGYCYGVERATRRVEDELKRKKTRIHTLGPLIHNPSVVKEFEALGVRMIEDVDEIKSGTLVIRSHGVEPQVMERARQKGLNLVDATCPFVKKAQKCVEDLAKEDYQVLIIGEKEHPEVKGLLAYSQGKGIIIESLNDLKNIKNKKKKIGIVVQTTQTLANLYKVVKAVLPDCFELKVFNTICNATFDRQREARRLSGKVDVMLVVGGKNSANTTRLHQICMEKNHASYHIESAEELKAEWFGKDMVVGVTAGASTPESVTENVVKRLEVLAGELG